MSDDPRRRACAALADWLAEPAGLAAARALPPSACRGAAAHEVLEAPRSAPPPWPISIWQPRGEGAERVWVRPEPLPLGDHYAARRELRPKRSLLPLRVVLFGESAAAGYLHAPHLTPAEVLAAQLRALGGAAAFEVVDLARTNERLDTLVETVERSLQINPDLLVLFAGNNWNLLETPEWSPYAPSPAARRRFALAWREGGPSGPIGLAAAALRARVEAAFARVALVARAVGIPVVAVVPEINLADWEGRQPPLWLPGGGAARWHRSYRRARRAVRERRWRDAADLARRMMLLDGGLCPTSHRLLALAQRGRGDLAAAARAARAEVAAVSPATLCFLGAPQATPAAQELVRAAARRHGFALVDLPAVFAAHSGSPLAGRRLFLDYCHLTRAGMHVAMAAVAAEVARLSGMPGLETDWRALVRDLPEPEVSAAAEATARLGAAVHGAHRLLAVGGKGAILEHWCREALAASPAVAGAMLDLAAARCAPLPAVLTAAQARNLDSPCRLLLEHGWRWDFLDAEALQAMGSALEESGHAARREIATQLMAHPGAAGADLARAPFLWEPLERFYPEAMAFDDLPARATLRAPWPESSFCLIGDGERDVALEVVARLPAIPGAEGRRRGRITVCVDGRPLKVWRGDETWRRVTLRVAGHLLRPGLNRLTVVWPPLPPLGDQALASALTTLELGREADLHPVFGELSTLHSRRPE